ncbi:hypothetical protein KJ966_27625 [bacterium]|nr:hypothetical protein [bacterium]
MKLEDYSKYVDLESKKEIDKCLYLGFYLLNINDKTEFSIAELTKCFSTLHFSVPNISRLKKNLQTSRAFIKGKGKSTYKLQAKSISLLSSELPDITHNSEEILSDDIILPESLYIDTRGYITSLAKQINASFENNIFDGCAVLMRRLLEILLILSYEKMAIDQEIKNDDGSYKLLNGIIGNAKTNTVLGLSRNSKDSLEEFRLVGNFSAHKIYYNAKKKDITSIAREYRAAIEELLYKSGLTK